MGLLLFNNAHTCSISTQFFPSKYTHVTANSFPSFSHFHVSFPSSGQKVGLRRRARVRTYGIKCSAKVDYVKGSAVVNEKSVSVILLAGGKGKRMGVSIYSYSFNCASMPKQYLPLLGQPIALYSLYTFSRMIEVKEIVVVCDPSYKDIFEEAIDKINVDLKFTLPGKERQDSVYSGLQHHLRPFVNSGCLPYRMKFVPRLIKGPNYGPAVLASNNSDLNVILLSEIFLLSTLLCMLRMPCFFLDNECYFHLQAVDLNSELVCIHDSARPLVRSGDVEKVLKDGWLIGAAVLGVPVKATIKEANSDSYVVKTLDRKTLWEMQTPQRIVGNQQEGLEVTDDVSIVEHLKHPVYVTEGCYTNIKVTTPDDLLLAERILNMSSAEPPK
ncbi:hypothetical protein CXB51_014172 [Gossypium anomalum]|uniref:2-C-methyl-D-erythritol 4-phosphate cytidylyltransferase n=1 Tax=Gossypium anomalum TaxID=47600 RepID=A0A8J6CXG0_9ROSI|nr:hypothetical protein CXB51_014172 [Gossypium anomalum]